MGRVIGKTKAGDKVYIECTDLSTDLSEYIKKYQEEGFKDENINVLVENEERKNSSPLSLNLGEFLHAKKQLDILTSHVEEDDLEEEKFAKIVTSIHKNIKYAYTKTGRRNVGKSQNFIDGLTKGKCVCIGISQILREALIMHDIDAKLIESNIDEEKGHEWNKVKLRGKWYNFDQTNIKSEILSLNNLAKNLKADEELEGKRIYINADSSTQCYTKPSQNLKDSINYYSKKNKNLAPKMPKDNLFSKIKNIFKKEKEETLKLPEPKMEERNESKKTDLQILDQKIIGVFAHQQMNLWRMTTWDKNDVANRVRTAYVGLDAVESLDSLIKNHKEKFWIVFEMLANNYKNQDNAFIGNITRKENAIYGISPKLIKDNFFKDKIYKYVETDIEKRRTQSRDWNEVINERKKDEESKEH